MIPTLPDTLQTSMEGVKGIRYKDDAELACEHLTYARSTGNAKGNDQNERAWENKLERIALASVNRRLGTVVHLKPKPALSGKRRIDFKLWAQAI